MCDAVDKPLALKSASNEDKATGGGHFREIILSGALGVTRASGVPLFVLGYSAFVLSCFHAVLIFRSIPKWSGKRRGAKKQMAYIIFVSEVQSHSREYDSMIA